MALVHLFFALLCLNADLTQSDLTISWSASSRAIFSSRVHHHIIHRRKRMNTQHHTAPSWRRWLVLACPPLVAIVCALTLTLPALAAKVFNISYPISGTATNPCNGEVITFSGNEHDTLAITLDGNGGCISSSMGTCRM
jgi:hypothetical protein